MKLSIHYYIILLKQQALLTGQSDDGIDGLNSISIGSQKSFIPSTNSPLAKSLSKNTTNESNLNREGASHVKKRLVYDGIEKEVDQPVLVIFSN